MNLSIYGSEVKMSPLVVFFNCVHLPNSRRLSNELIPDDDLN